MNPIFLILATSIYLISTVAILTIIKKGENERNLRKHIFGFAAYQFVSVLLIFLWNGRFLISENFGVFDWHKEAYYFHFLRENLVEFRPFPLSFIYLPGNLNWYPTLSKTLSYWANPEVITFSPLFLFIPFLSTIAFIKFYFLSHLLFGVMGIYTMFRRLKLGVVEILMMFVMIVLNPWLMQHLAIGFTPFIQFCLLPMIIAMLITPRLKIMNFVYASILNALVVYSGGWHIFFVFNGAVAVFYVIYAIRRKITFPMIQAFVFYLLTGVLIFPKMVAVLSIFHGWKREIQSSYGSLADLWGLLTDGNAPLYDIPRSFNIYGVNLYDGSMLMGEWFVILLICCVLFSMYRHAKPHLVLDPYPAFPSLEVVISGVIFCILGWDGVWKALADIFPVLGSKIYPWHLAFASIFFFIVFVTWESLMFIRTYFRSYIWITLAGIIIFSPLLHTMYTRNKLFIDVLTEQSDMFADFNLKRLFLEKGIQDPSCEPDSTPNRVVICPKNRDEILLQWLDKRYIEDFNLDNARYQSESPGHFTELSVLHRTKRITMRPKDFSRIPLLLCMLFLYTGIVFVVWSCQKKLTGREVFC